MTMSDPGPLLVPVETQAMVLNTDATLIRGHMHYDNLASCRSPSPAPFQQDDVANHGVYLRWTLPKALRHGQQKPDGTLDFLFVPNRWLVVRIYRPAGSAVDQPQVAAWVVQSDFLNSDDGSYYIDPTKATLTQTMLGRKVLITADIPWHEPAATSAYFLKAVAESNPAFAAYQPFHQNVFSIHDDLKNVGAGTLSYFVQGWVSDSKAEVFAQMSGAGVNFSAILERLGWTASATENSSTACIYHGAVFGVPWAPNAPAPPASPKDGVHPQIAVGNTSVDAVIAFAEAAFSAPGAEPPAGLTAAQAAELLEAFEYNLLPVLAQPDGEGEVDQKVRCQWFGSAAAGAKWTIVDAPVPPGSPAPPPISENEAAAEAAWLTTLNAAQGQFDQTKRSLMAMRRSLYELWWKQQAAEAILDQSGYYPWRVTPDEFTRALDPTDSAGLIAQTRGYLGRLATLSAQIPAAGLDVDFNQAIHDFAVGKNLPATRTLKPVSEPRFWTAVDPVLVLSNTAHLLTIDPDATLFCRWPAEIVTSLKVTAGSGGPAFTIGSAQLAEFQPAVNWAHLPAVSAALFAEFFLLDPANAPLVAAAAHQTLNGAQLEALASSMAAPAPQAGLVPRELAAYPWTQPWQPLYLDWEITWYQIPFRNSQGDANWAFDGADYDLVSGVTAPVSTVLTGRGVLTPKPSFEFQSRIDQFIADYPDSKATQTLQEVENLVAKVDGWDFLSQSLGGLKTQLASWNPVPTVTLPTVPLPGGTQSLAELIADQAQCPPSPALDKPGHGVPTSMFEAMRGGQFFFSRLTIVDVFGQTLEVVAGQTDSQTSVIVGEGLHVTHAIDPLNVAGLVQLPPRLLQPARLNFQFSPVSNGNPILGWVIPNHLDGDLAVYGADGALYGELSPAVNARSERFVYWWQAPDSPYTTLPALQNAHAELGGFLARLQAAGPEALADFLRSVDETLWSVDPLGDRGDAFLSALLGRPLAVVAAAISFELQAEAWRDPAWPFTFSSPDPLFLGYQFPVQLGNLTSLRDGLLGYFVDGNYEKFSAVHVAQPGPNDPPLSGYLSQIGPNNWLRLGFAASGPSPGHKLTLVMDPRAAVHAQCGILPTKDVTLLSEWVDSALAGMKATFRTGPLLAEMRQLIPQGQKEPVSSLLTPCPAEKNGKWQWRQLAGDGAWPVADLAPVDDSAVFPDAPPILRDGALQLSGGLAP